MSRRFVRRKGRLVFVTATLVFLVVLTIGATLLDWPTWVISNGAVVASVSNIVVGLELSRRDSDTARSARRGTPG